MMIARIAKPAAQKIKHISEMLANFKKRAYIAMH
jgi:hypothetical protein